MPGKNTDRACNFQSIARLEMAWTRSLDCGSRYAEPKASWQDQPKLCSSHRRLRHRVPAAEQKSRNVKATSGRPVAPPPPAAAQAAAPNRQQNAGTKNPNPICFNQKSTDPELTATPNGPPDQFSLLPVHCHCCSSKYEHSSVLPLFHLVPGRCGSRGRLTPVLGPLPPPEGFPPSLRHLAADHPTNPYPLRHQSDAGEQPDMKCRASQSLYIIVLSNIVLLLIFFFFLCT